MQGLRTQLRVQTPQLRCSTNKLNIKKTKVKTPERPQDDPFRPYFLSGVRPRRKYYCVVIVVLGCLGASVVKNLPAMQETWLETQVQSLGQKDPVEKEWQPTPVFLPGKSHGQRSLAGCSPWGHKESDTTSLLSTHTVAEHFPVLIVLLIHTK